MVFNKLCTMFNVILNIFKYISNLSLNSNILFIVPSAIIYCILNIWNIVRKRSAEFYRWLLDSLWNLLLISDNQIRDQRVKLTMFWVTLNHYLSVHQTRRLKISMTSARTHLQKGKSWKGFNISWTLVIMWNSEHRSIKK